MFRLHSFTTPPRSLSSVVSRPRDGSEGGLVELQMSRLFNSNNFECKSLNLLNLSKFLTTETGCKYGWERFGLRTKEGRGFITREKRRDFREGEVIKRYFF